MIKTDKDMETEKIEPEKEISYYSYDSPCVTIIWNNKTQPMGFFKSAEDALSAIDKLGFGRKNFQINTPDKLINLT